MCCRTTRDVRYGTGKHGQGTIRILAEEIVGDDSETLSFVLSGHDFPRVDWFGPGADPYFVLNRVLADGTQIAIVKSEIIKGNRSPVWPAVEFPTSELLAMKPDETLVLEVWDWDNSSSHDLIGQVQLTEPITQTLVGRDIYLEKKGKQVHSRGKVRFETVTITRIPRPPSFIDYLSAGLGMSLIVSIDYTASNGEPNQVGSLHYFNPNDNHHTQYSHAIFEVGQVLEPYDTDRMFPVYGFGAKLPDGVISHFFPLNGNPNNPEVYGVQGLLDIYRQVTPAMKLYGPTNFAPSINAAIDYAMRSDAAARSRGSLGQYTILLIITDGEITDMAEAILAVIRASSVPLSIVIVGVGDADFKSMVMLDADSGPLQSRGQTSKRDCVQFIEFRKVAGNPHHVAVETLKEVPSQVLTWCKLAGRFPVPPTSWSWLFTLSSFFFFFLFSFPSWLSFFVCVACMVHCALLFFLSFFSLLVFYGLFYNRL